MKKKLIGLFLLVSSVGLLSSCGPTGVRVKANLVYGTLYEENDDPHSHFVQSFREKDGETISTHYTPYSTLKTLVERQESFALVNVPSFTCLCWGEFRNNCLLPYMKEHNLRVYLMRQSDLEGIDVVNRFGISSASDPEVCIFERGSLIAQKEAKTGEAFHDSYESFASWMNDNIDSYPQMLYVNDGQLDALYAGDSPFLIYYSRFSCSDCSCFQTDFLNSYLAGRHLNPLTSAYIIDCDQEGVRYLNGEYNQDQWDAYKESHGLTDSEANPSGYGTGYVPTLMQISPKDGAKIGDVITAMDVYFNDAYALQSDGTYAITASYFDEERINGSSLSYLKESDVETKVLQGLNLGSYDGEPPYSWYQEKMAPYHNAIALAFLENYLPQF